MVVGSIPLLEDLHAKIYKEGFRKMLHPLPQRLSYGVVLDVCRSDVDIRAGASSDVGPTPHEGTNVVAANAN